MSETNLVAASLEALAENDADPTAAVYQRLFARSPEMEALFVNDIRGAARGEMLAMVFETLLDLAQAGYYAPNMIRAEIVNHENLGVPPVVFASFFPVVMETVREKLGDAWTGETQAAWDQLLGQLEDLVSEHSKS
jgi:hemoglobin-like flavoprotein